MIRLYYGFGLFVVLCCSAYGQQELSRYSGDGEVFDFVIETSGEKTQLYLAEKASNAPVKGASVELIPDDEGAKAIAFSPTNKDGVYLVDLQDGNLPEGSLRIQVAEKAEDVEVYQEDAANHHEEDEGDHGHAHGGAAKKPIKMSSNTVMVFLSLGFLFVGFLLGRVGRLPIVNESQMIKRLVNWKKESSSDFNIDKVGVWVLIGLLPTIGFNAKTVQASEGHTHAEVGIGDDSSSKTIKVSKKSQFMIGLRVVVAEKADIKRSLRSYGHLMPRPNFDAMIKSPVPGFLKPRSGVVLGSLVKKGELLGVVSGINSVELRAPISGEVIEAKAVDGARVDSGEMIYRVADTSVLWVDAQVFQKDLQMVRGSEGASVFLEGTTSEPVPAKIMSMKSIVDESNLTAKIYLEVDGSNQSWVLGSLVDVAFQVNDKAGSIDKKGFVLPSAAVLTRGSERIVFVQTGPEEFEAKSVSSGHGPTLGTVVVEDGLEDGDRVVTTGNYQLLVGAK